MKVNIQAAVLNSDEDHIHLDNIVHHFKHGRHLWNIQEEELDTILESAWVKASKPAREIVDSVEKTFAYDIYPENKFHTKQIFITTTPSSEIELTPYDAANYLSRPAYVMVENSVSDGDYFLDAMIEAFDRKELKYAQEGHWWEYRHLGGSGEVENQVEQLKKNLKGKLLRLVVIVDSDKRHTEHLGSATQCKRYCEEQGIDHWVLMKRSIENYLPLEQFPEEFFHKKENFIQAFKKLTREQRDFYNLKKGFELDENKDTSIPKDQQKLFSNLSQDTKDALCGSLGKGSKTAECFKTQRNFITREAMIAVCSPDGNPPIYASYAPDPNEIPTILDLIEAQI